MNFSTLADIYKLNKVTKAYAAGDSQPLVDVLSFPFDEIYTFEKTTDYESFDEYKVYLKEKLDAFYEKEVQGKKIIIILNSTYNDPYEEMYSIDTPISCYCYSFYDQDYNVIFSIDFGKLGPNKFSLSDYSSYSETNIFNEEITDYLLPTEELTTNALLSFTDVLFSVDTFDADSGYWVYKVMFELENQENGKRCIMEYFFRFYDYRLYVIPGTTPSIIGEEVLSETQIQQLLTLFDV